MEKTLQTKSATGLLSFTFWVGVIFYYVTVLYPVTYKVAFSEFFMEPLEEFTAPYEKDRRGLSKKEREAVFESLKPQVLAKFQRETETFHYLERNMMPISLTIAAVLAFIIVSIPAFTLSTDRLQAAFMGLIFGVALGFIEFIHNKDGYIFEFGHPYAWPYFAGVILPSIFGALNLSKREGKTFSPVTRIISTVMVFGFFAAPYLFWRYGFPLVSAIFFVIYVGGFIGLMWLTATVKGRMDEQKKQASLTRHQQDIIKGLGAKGWANDDDLDRAFKK